jgi:hypothetical protein
MTPAGSQAAPGCIAGRPACVEPSMSSDPDRRRVVPSNGGRQQERERALPQPTEPRVPAHRAGRRASSCVTKDGQPLGAGGRLPFFRTFGRPPTLPRPGDPGPAGNPVRAIPGRLGPASRASRLTAPASMLSVARWPFGIVLRSIGVVSDRGTADFLRARENPGGRMTCDTGRMELLSCGVGRPLVPGVVRDSPVACGPNVAQRS